MIAVVTGTSGFIGSHLVDELLARGATVRALLRPDSKPHLHRGGVTCWTADLSDERAVRECEVWHQATHVFHVAGITKARTLGQFREGNVVPTANILSGIAARAPNIRRFVLVSSQAAAGPALDADHPIKESDIPTPVESYGRSKLEAEDATRMASATLPVTTIRPGAVYGPRDVDFLNVFREVTHLVAFHAAPKDQMLSIVHVRDLVKAIILAAESPVAIGKTYFVAAAESTTWQTLYRNVATIAGTTPLEVQVPGFMLTLAGYGGSLFSLITRRPVLVNTNKVALSRPKWWLCDSSQIRKEIGWTDEITLQHGLRETYLSYLQTGWLRPQGGGHVAHADQLEE